MGKGRPGKKDASATKRVVPLGEAWGSLPVANGKYSFPVYQSRSRGGKPLFAVSFYLPYGKPTPGCWRKRVTTDDEHAIGDLAPKIERLMEQAQMSKITLWGRDATIWGLSQRVLEPLGTTLHDVVKEWAAAKERLGELPLMEAVEGYFKWRPKAIPSVTVEQLCELYIAAHPLAAETQTNYKVEHKRLVAFLRQLDPPIELVSEFTAEAVRHGMNESGFKLPARKLLVKVLVRLFEHAMDEGILPRGPTEVDKLKMRGKKKTKAQVAKLPEIYMPEDIEAMIGMFWPKRYERRTFRDRVLMIVLGAFAGVRPFEAPRVLWKHVILTRNQIYVPAELTKTGKYREIPLEPNLRAFLRVLKPKGAKGTDPIVQDSKQASNLPVAVTTRGVPWKQDGLRHSYATYFFARKDNPEGLVMAMGTSTAKLYQNYRGRVRRASDVAAYWGIMPPKDDEARP